MPSGDIKPLWRMDTRNLEADLAKARACLAGPDEELDACAASRACEAGSLDAETTSGARQCAWRDIAAWEDVMERQLTALRPVLGEELAGSQARWYASMIADVGLASSLYKGGSLQGVIAAGVRAELTARRAIWLENLRRQIG